MVSAATAREGVITGFAVELVVAKAAHQLVVPGFAIERIITAAFADHVISTGAMGDVITHKEDIGFEIFDAGIALDHIGQ